MRQIAKKPWFDLVVILASGGVVCLGLYLYSIVLNHGITDPFLVVNLLLAGIPILLSWRLVVVLKKKLWSAWEPLLYTFLWIIFLPNSFYMVSDYIHLESINPNVILYSAVMYTAFIFLALLLGVVSLYIVHQELKKRISKRSAAMVVVILLLGCSFAIYLGRDMRWDSWDIVLNPGGVLFDISNLLLQPHTYPDMMRTITSFFALLGSIYFIIWRFAYILWRSGVKDMARHIKQEQHNPKLS